MGYGLGRRAATNSRRIVRADAPPGAGDPGSELTFLPLPLDRGGGVTVSGRF